jgi:hypothetical protein
MRWQYPLDFAISVFSFCVILLVVVGQAGAAGFTIDSSQSQITLSGTVSGYTFTAQGAGSLTAACNGSVNATVSGSAIQFTGPSAIAAITNGVWRPVAGGLAGSAPADYGAQVNLGFLFGTAYGAVRSLVLGMTSPLLTLTQTNFDSSKLIISIVTNSNPVLDFSSSLGSGSTSLSGDSTNSIATGSSISTNGDLVQLVIQINTTFATTNSALTLTGKIVATNSLSASVPPVITRVVATNQNFVLTVSNATMQSLLLSSTDLTTWSPASATISTNGGFIIFKTPMSGPRTFFRMQK